MPWPGANIESGILSPRAETGRLIAPEEVAGRIVNMTMTLDGTLRSCVGPLEYTPTAYVDVGDPPTVRIDYRLQMLGLFHCMLEGGKRDVLLSHHKDDTVLGSPTGVWVWNGWSRDWQLLLTDDGSLLALIAEVPDPIPESDGRFAWNTQFEATPNGVVIVPQGGRAYFYDGTVIAPLGFEQVPAPPEPVANPSVQSSDGVSVVEFDSSSGSGPLSGRDVQEAMGFHRIGSVDKSALHLDGATKRANTLGGILGAGEFRMCTQFVDRWGNLSAPSAPSSAANFIQENNLLLVDSPKFRLFTGGAAGVTEPADALKKQIIWTDIDPGPAHTLGRLLYRSHDQKNTETPGHFWVSPSAGADQLAFATIHDRTTTIFVDNIPDAWLVVPMPKTVPVPRFQLCKMFAGRLFIANTPTDPGLVMWSEPGFWGTFLDTSRMFPDAGGAEITGFCTTRAGLLVFTRQSTYLVRVNDEGTGFRSERIHATVGCVAPDSVQMLPSGMAVWLSQEGFYAYDGQQVAPIYLALQDKVLARLNRPWAGRAVAAVDSTRGLYRCWIPVDGSTVANLGLEFDGQGWREITYMTAVHAACTTRDSRQYMLVQGNAAGADRRSIWLLDHEGLAVNTPDIHESSIETAWLRAGEAKVKGTARMVSLFLRETGLGQLTVEVMRDWREHPTIAASGAAPATYEVVDPPLVWGTAVYGGTIDDPVRKQEGIATYWTRRRPFWTRVDVYVPSCETFRVRLKYTGDWEFLGMSYGDDPKRRAGADLSKGQ